MNSSLRKITECVLPILVLSTLLFPYSNVLGENTFRPQTMTETLLAIVEKANATVVAIYADLRAKGLQIPQEALILYAEALGRADESVSLRNSGNYEEANVAAVEALKKFKESLDVVYDEIQEPSVQIESLIEVMMRLNNSIIRGFRYLSYIENLSYILEAKGYDITLIEDKIQSAKGLLYKALRELHRYELKSVNETLLMVKDLLSTVTQRLETVSSDLKVGRLETYIVNADERIYLLKAKVLSPSSELSPEAKDASLTALQSAENSLDNARSYLDAQMVSEAVSELVQAKESEEEALRIISTNQTSVNSVSDLETSSSYQEQVS